MAVTRLFIAWLALAFVAAGCGSGAPWSPPGPDWDFFGIVDAVEFIEPYTVPETLTSGGPNSPYSSGPLVIELTNDERIEVPDGTPGGNTCRDFSGPEHRECIVAGALTPDGEAEWFEVLHPSKIAQSRGSERSVSTVGVSGEDGETVIVRGLRLPKHPNYDVSCHTGDTVEAVRESGLPTTATIDLATWSVIVVSCVAED